MLYCIIEQEHSRVVDGFISVVVCSSSNQDLGVCAIGVVGTIAIEVTFDEASSASSCLWHSASA
jgi:hypothetical protein